MHPKHVDTALKHKIAVTLVLDLGISTKLPVDFWCHKLLSSHKLFSFFLRVWLSRCLLRCALLYMSLSMFLLHVDTSPLLSQTRWHVPQMYCPTWQGQWSLPIYLWPQISTARNTEIISLTVMLTWAWETVDIKIYTLNIKTVLVTCPLMIRT